MPFLPLTHTVYSPPTAPLTELESPLSHTHTDHFCRWVHTRCRSTHPSLLYPGETVTFEDSAWLQATAPIAKGTSPSSIHGLTPKYFSLVVGFDHLFPILLFIKITPIKITPSIHGLTPKYFALVVGFDHLLPILLFIKITPIAVLPAARSKQQNSCRLNLVWCNPYTFEHLKDMPLPSS
jgi:hypothetical protein